MKWMKTVVVESPYAGDNMMETRRNVLYLRACMRDCLNRGEAPYASHGLYTQPGVLDDSLPEERELGMDAGFSIGFHMDTVVVYTDRGISPGMRKGIQVAEDRGRPVIYREIPDVAVLIANLPLREEDFE
jgi:hypothetical protein